MTWALGREVGIEEDIMHEDRERWHTGGTCNHIRPFIGSLWLLVERLPVL